MHLQFAFAVLNYFIVMNFVKHSAGRKHSQIQQQKNINSQEVLEC